MFQIPPTLDKREQERNRADQAALATLDAEDLWQWKVNSCTDRLYFGLGYELVSWRFDSNLPEAELLGNITDVHVAKDRLIYTLESSKFLKLVSHAPTRIHETNFFVWVPYFNEIRCNASQDGGTYLSLSLCVSQPSNPTKVQIGGHKYLTTRQRFNREWNPETVKTNL